MEYCWTEEEESFLCKPIEIPINNHDCYMQWLNPLSLTIEQFRGISNSCSNDWSEICSYRTCVNCGCKFQLSSSLGKKQCLYHPGFEETRFGAGGASLGVWTCCGKQTSNPYKNHNYETRSVHGCKSADHQFYKINSSDASISIPLSIYLALQYTGRQPPVDSINSITFIRASKEDETNYTWNSYIDIDMFNVKTNTNPPVSLSQQIHNSSSSPPPLLLHKLNNKQNEVLKISYIDLSKSSINISMVES